MSPALQTIRAASQATTQWRVVSEIAAGYTAAELRAQADLLLAEGWLTASAVVRAVAQAKEITEVAA